MHSYIPKVICIQHLLTHLRHLPPLYKKKKGSDIHGYKGALLLDKEHFGVQLVTLGEPAPTLVLWLK